MVDRLFLSIIFLSVVFLSSVGLAQSPAYVIIVERPQNLSILNKYQQQATLRERALFVPFAPIIVVQNDVILSDDFTKCLKVEIGDEPSTSEFFLVLNKNRKLARSDSLGYEKTFYRAVILQDSVEILSNNSIRCTSVSSVSLMLKSGQKVHRIFHYRNAVYCKLLDTQFFGWITFSEEKEEKDWKMITSVSASQTTFTYSMIQRIQERVTAANQLMQKFFEYFNSTTRQQKSVPQWQVEVSDHYILCVLEGSDSENFHQSTAYLAKDLQNIILGSDLVLEQSVDEIEIRRR